LEYSTKLRKFQKIEEEETQSRGTIVPIKYRRKELHKAK
jgi:hypothetical protein